MKVTANALFKRVSYFTLAFVLAVSTLTAAVPFILSEKASAISIALADVVVDGAFAGTPGSIGGSGKPTYANIPAAAAGAANGSTIVVKNGTYNDVTPGYDTLRIPQNKALKLSAENTHGVTINVPVIIKNTGGYTFDGFVVRDFVRDFGIWVDGTNNPTLETRITNNKFLNISAENAEVEGIFLGDSNKTYSNIVVSGNEVSNITSVTKGVSGIAANGTGINITITNNIVSNTLRGINTAALKATSSATVTGNTLYNNVPLPLHISGYTTASGNITTAPDTTAPVAPVNGQPGTTNTNDFYFTWDAVVDGGSPIVEYQFQSSASSAVSGGSLVSTWKNWVDGNSEQIFLATPTIHSTNALDGQYYWQVRAIDQAGNVGAWSAVWTTQIDSVAPTGSWQKQPEATYKTGDGFHVRPRAGEDNLTKAVYVDEVTSAKLVRTQTGPEKNLDTKNTNNQALWDSLSDGTHKFIAVFTDASGNSFQVSSNTFIIDRTNPTVTVKPESIGNIAAGVYSNVSFKLFDELQIDKVTINGVEKDLGNNKYSDLNGVKPGTFGAVAGTNTLVVYDVAGNTTTVTFFLDNTAPTITLKAESLGSNGKFRNASFKLFDANKIDKVTVNGLVKDLTDNKYSDLNGVKPGTFGAIEGTNTIVVYDIAGNTTTYTLVLDITSPIPTISYSTTAATRNSVTAFLNTNEQIALPAGWTASDATGTKFFKVYAENVASDAFTIADFAGNTSATAVAINWIDNTAPVAVLDSLASFRVRGQVEIKGSVSDNFAFGHYNLSLYNATVDLSDGEAHASDRIATTGWITTGTTPVIGTSAAVSRELDTTALADGSYQVRLAARDAAGNRNATDSVKYFTIVIDNTAPTTVSVTYSPSALTNQPVVATLTVNEAINTPSGWTAAPESTTVFTKSYSANTTETVNYTDLAGNPGSASVAIDWIDTAPAEATVSYSNEAPTNQPVIATISTNEPINTPTGWAQVNGSTTEFTKTYAANASETVIVTDYAGNSTNVSVSITWIDTTAPVITSLTASNATVRGTVSFVVNDGDATVRVNGVITTASQVSGDGTYTVIATDAVGNVSIPFTFTIDNSQAIVVNAFDLETATPLITGSAIWNADGTPAETVTVTIDGNPYAATIDADGNWSVQVIEPLTDGEHTLVVNGVSTTFTTTLPTTFNAPAIVSPAAAVLGDATQNTPEQNNGSNETGVAGANTAQNLAAADTDANKGLLFGLAWYWWILILAALTALAWWIIGAIRRRREEQN